ncbi:hypothetical protein rosmuc_00262 [Roseovarius mucosus DSM 17069]|uniref:Uncharacterized protein n=1 Tax=Roseovarius mucosus DSM 17069 TaxID=1288298 RepID=A0A0A0HU95_9RHOB|nr:hypothetical protein [Roseovarius mucosus]KGM89668.1 hypothetical protein rosmuc_00262 [Roseovarius mucosus DSM 17069]
MEIHWIDSPKHKADRKELANLCGRTRTPAEDARYAELKARVRKWAGLNQAAEDFVNGAP